MVGAQQVAAFLDTQGGEEQAIMRRLRTLALGAAPDVTEHIKWNAPSFCVGGDDRITLGIERNGGVRAVIHRGAKAKETTGFAFADTDALAKWPAPDRGVVTFRSEADVIAAESKIADLFARWLAATA